MHDVRIALERDPARAQHLDLADWERLSRTFNELYPHGLEMNAVPASADFSEGEDLEEWDDDAPDVHDDDE